MTTTTQTSTTQTYAPARSTTTTGWVTTFRSAVRARRANRSALSREIAAYPASRGVAVTVLPSASR